MANTTTDHNEIRNWAESKGGKPAAVDRTHKGDDIGIVRIMFPDNPQSEHQHLVEISWDEFFEQFEESNLALVYGENSLFSKIVGRDTADARAHGEHTSRRELRAEGKSGGRAGSQPPKSNDRGSHSSGRGDGDLKSREYKDEQGNVHHHTKEYMEKHGSGR
jgi:hypothetical protein